MNKMKIPEHQVSILQKIFWHF